MSRYRNIFIKIAGLSGALAVSLGAYGAHEIRTRGDDHATKIFETANRYHFFHTLALLGVHNCKHPLLAGSLFSVGMLIFSGSCYYQALTGYGPIRQVTPFGGVLLIFGWLSLLI